MESTGSTGSNQNDCKLLEATLQSFAREKPEPTPSKPPHTNLDICCDYEEGRTILQAHGLIAHIRSRRQEAKDEKRPPGSSRAT